MLLTISIPTYNRANYLDKCLKSIFDQIESKTNLVEILVSDNCSTDETNIVIKKYIDYGCKIEYYRNDKNLGFDRNFASCFSKAKGKYVWVLGDDDIILFGHLNLILDLLEANNFGVIYLNSSWHDENEDLKHNAPKFLEYDIYKSPIEFVERVNYWFTFISGNIVNKSLYKNSNIIPEFYDSLLVQLSWVLPLCFSGNDNIVIKTCSIACVKDNSGGYKLFEVFGKNLNYLIQSLIDKNLIQKETKEIMNRNLLLTFFPSFIKNRKATFIKESYINALLPVFWRYKIFWKIIFFPYIKTLIKRN